MKIRLYFILLFFFISTCSARSAEPSNKLSEKELFDSMIRHKKLAKKILTRIWADQKQEFEFSYLQQHLAQIWSQAPINNLYLGSSKLKKAIQKFAATYFHISHKTKRSQSVMQSNNIPPKLGALQGQRATRSATAFCSKNIPSNTMFTKRAQSCSNFKTYPELNIPYYLLQSTKTALIKTLLVSKNKDTHNKIITNAISALNDVYDHVRQQELGRITLLLDEKYNNLFIKFILNNTRAKKLKNFLKQEFNLNSPFWYITQRQQVAMSLKKYLDPDRCDWKDLEKLWRVLFIE